MKKFAFIIYTLFSISSAIQAEDEKEQLLKADALYQTYIENDSNSSLQEAAKNLDHLNEVNPSDYQILWRCARVYYSLADIDGTKGSEKIRLLEKAIACAKNAIALNSKGVEAHYWLGVSLGDYADTKGMFKAISLLGDIRKEMEKVIELQPDYENAGAYLVLGRMDFQLPGFMGGDKKRAMSEYEHGLKIFSSNFLLKTYLAESYIREGRKEEAKKLLNEVLSSPINLKLNPEAKDAQKEAKALRDRYFSKS